MVKKKIDKRTKAYKEEQRNKLSKEIGLGDVVEKITEATGIKKAVKWLANGKDCGCDGRQEKLNKLPFKFKFKPNCMVESEFNWFTDYLKRHNKDKYSKGDVFELVRLYRRLFKITPKICANCNSGVKAMQNVVSDITKLYETYTL